ncbi:hypothetical protein GCM10010435_67120 [Winogradskya consettensis]|uniref:DNA-binding protein n=1 Tax=Winogradskya consettensis TaxID=113560 RepID=A0A919SMY2_9ACTN|nr:hypothetical protein [Actinoplanes consettensis]GIM73883.1 hypothetical protein Aco04nite_37640 [Actinoplanes consettensis]
MSDVLLEAGAVLPGPPGDGALDAVAARSYRHPVLEGRTVVRLVGAAVGAAEDLSMEFLGFAPAGEPVAVGHARRQALGFPAWALVHDPANGRHALALVKEMEKLARVATGKPGNAKDGYDALARRLDAAAPQFLPTFWEQAGRAFTAAGNARMAGTCFTAARRAEQVHGLVVDEDRVRDVHLEFAFAGALTAAMLAEYTRGVVDRRAASEAYELVKSLALQRVAGGLSPHVSMAADLARLAKAAGRDPEAETDEVVTRLLSFPAMGRAHPSVWKAYRKSLVRLGRRDAAIRARLLEIVPEPPGYNTDMTDQWLELLSASGADAALTTVAAGFTPGLASRWLERLLARRLAGRKIRSERLLALVERMIPRLVADDGVQLAASSWTAELDVLDLCVAGGVRVGIGPGHRGSGFDVAAWSQDEGAGRRDLAAIAADPGLRPALALGVGDALSRLRTGTSLNSPALPVRTLELAFSAAGVRDVLTGLILERTGRAGDATITALDADLSGLAPLWSPAGMALAPGGFRRLHELDAAAVVARTLRAGLLAELCWPAYEAVAKEKKGIQIGAAWPQLVVHDQQSAHVIEPDGATTEHAFRYPAAGQRMAPSAYTRVSCLHADGDLIVSWQSEHGPAAYWASRPAELTGADWQLQRPGWGVPATPLPLPGGGVTTGAQPVHAGDARGPGHAYPMVSDGQAFWRCEWERGDSGDHAWRWREFDPLTGDGGRVSVPAFLAGATGELVAEASRLHPAPKEFAASPLGWHDGLIGWRVTTTASGTQTGEGVDGRRVTLSGVDGRDEPLVGAVTMPGSAAPLPVTRRPGYPGGRMRVWTADGGHVLAEVGEQTMTLPPFEWWHALRARDEAGSAALRAIDETTSAALLAVDDTVSGTVRVKEAVAANVAAHLPEVTDTVLRARVVEVVALAVRMRRRIAEIPRHLGAQAAPERPLPAVTDSAIRLAWDGLTRTTHNYYSGPSGPRHQILEQVTAVGELLAGSDLHGDIPAATAGWTALLTGLGAVALRAASAVTTDADRMALTALLTAIAGTPLAGDGPPLRVLELTLPRMTASEVVVHRDGPQVTVLFPPEQHYTAGGYSWSQDAVQVSPTGVFTLPPDLTVRNEVRPGGRLGGARLTAFCTLLAERGPAPWRPEAAEALAAATGMTRAEATLLLAGLPGIQVWEANFLTPEQRATLGLTSAQAKVARAALVKLHAERVALLDAAMPADPAGLWERGPDVDAVAQEWIRLRGRRIAVPEELVAELARVIDDARAAAVLQAIAGPQDGDWLSTDGRSRIVSYHDVRTEADGGEPFDEIWLHAVAVALPWLAYRLSWDDPLRAALPGALELVRARLRNPHLLAGTGVHPVTERPDAGPALVDGHAMHSFVTHHVVPAKLTGDDDPALGFVDDGTATALRILLSGWIDGVVSSPDDASGEPHDPRVSVPHLVAEAAERFGCDSAVAAYYLQLLALPDPTDKAVQAWNGWKPAALRKAQEALTTAGLVVAAKRERAGRPVFLPGGWLPARAPRLPVETWKQSLYVEAGNRRVVPLALPELFAAAWSRVTAGDVPRYHDLKEQP